MKDNTKDEFKNYIKLLKEYVTESKIKIKSSNGTTKDLLEIYIQNLITEINIISNKVTSKEFADVRYRQADR